MVKLPSFDNRITLQKLEVFCTVASCGGVVRAAEELFLTQPVVSAHLKDLQERLGARLLERDGRGVRLTEAGHSVHRWAQEVLRGREDVAGELQQLASGESGRVRIGAGMSVGNYLLPDLLVDFKIDHPGVQIVVENSTVEAALDGVLSNRLDFCLVASSRTLDADLFSVSLIARPRYALVAAAEDDHISDRMIGDELRELNFICPPSGTRIRDSQDFALSTIGVADRTVVMEMGSAESIKYAVSRGLGVSLLWRASVSKELAGGVLKEISIDGLELRDNLYAVQTRTASLTPVQRRLRDALVARIKQRDDM